MKLCSSSTILTAKRRGDINASPTLGSGPQIDARGLGVLILTSRENSVLSPQVFTYEERFVDKKWEKDYAASVNPF